MKKIVEGRNQQSHFQPELFSFLITAQDPFLIKIEQNVFVHVQLRAMHFEGIRVFDAVHLPLKTKDLQTEKAIQMLTST